jgi:hypothetical protein
MSPERELAACREELEKANRRQHQSDLNYDALERLLKQAESRLASHAEREEKKFDMLKHLARQREWSERTFGPGPRTAGVIDHIRKELKEIEDAPGDVSEWIDVTILALDGAWRAGFTPEQIVAAIQAKQAKNESRKWPDWRTSPPDKAIEHDRAAPSPAGPNHAEREEGSGMGEAMTECVAAMAQQEKKDG